jgi:outer membrane protein OmpA-like peptidoglycan-associated protein
MRNTWRSNALTLTFLLCCASFLFAQKSEYKVDRCSAVNRGKAVQNIKIDGDNVKWVGNPDQVTQVRGCDLGTPQPLQAGEQSVLNYFGGNTDKRWLSDVLRAEAQNAVDITAAWYDAGNDWLWIGTRENGLFQFKTSPALTLLDQFSAGKSKLPSNEVTLIFQDPGGKYWIGTKEGLMTGVPKKWKNDLDGYQVNRVRAIGPDLYVMADGELWVVQSGDKWRAINIDQKAIEGEPVDFDLDPTGNCWILSRMVARYNLLTDEFETFSGPELYTSEYGQCIAADNDGAAWIGTQDKGLYYVSQKAAFTITLLADPEPACTGNGKDAGILVKLNGGKTPFTYAWSNTALQGEHPTGLSAGIYTVTVTDFSGATKTAKITLPDPRPKAVARQKQAESGPGKSDGVAEAGAEAGLTPYSYQWSNGETAATARKLSEGTYTVTVTDAKGCTATATVTMSQKILALTAAIEETSPIKCNNGKTTLKVTVSGGKAPYTYRWNNPELQGAQPNNAPRGDYSVTVTDAAGTSTTALLKVKEPDVVIAIGTIDAPAATGKANGKATVQPKGGNGAYTYQWSNGETGITATQLPAGPFTVTVTDGNKCVALFAGIISENILPLQAKIAENGKINCAGEALGLEVSVSGGKAPYAFRWSNTTMQGDKPSGVRAGDYALTVTDAAGGVFNTQVRVKEPELVTASALVQAPAATGQSNGRATISAKGGAGKFVYAWDNGETAATASALSPGLHRATVTDANGCSFNVEVTITENILPLQVQVSETGKIKCSGENSALETQVSGGKAPYTFTWNGGLSGEKPASVKAGDYTLTVADATGTTASATIRVKEPDPLNATALAQAPAATGKSNGKATLTPKGGTGKYSYAWDNGETTATAVALAPGKHTGTITDANGCSATAEVNITENILPLQVQLAEKGKIKCAGDKTGIAATVGGGKAPFNFIWNKPELVGETPDNVPAGEYTLTVTDASGLSATASINLRQPQSIAINASVSAPASTGNSDGKASAQALGGAGKFTFAWDNGETTAAATRLAPGKHNVTVTDGSGCTATAEVNITENILPLTLNLSESGKIKCNGDKSTLKASVSGGKGPFNYQWSQSGWQGDLISDAGPGTYTLTVTDSKNNSQTATVTVRSPEILQVKVIGVLGATTERTKDGRATLQISGGTTPYTIAWDNLETTATAGKLTQGTHSATITDANGCQATASVETGKRILPELTAAVLQSGQAIKVEQMQFEADSSRLTPACYPVLDEIYNFLEENGSIVIEVGGHTNNAPSDAFADRLSTARAKSAADYLIAKGIDPKRVLYKGYGKRNPIANNNTADGRKRNQRVEIKVLQLKKE